MDTRRFRSVILATALFGWGCVPAGDGGTAGTSGTAGASGTTGSGGSDPQGNAGTTGSGGSSTPGTGGTGGSSTAGTGGSSTAGTGGSTTGASGTGGSSGGTTGSAGTTGSGGSAAGRGGTTGAAGRGGTTGTGGAGGAAGRGGTTGTGGSTAGTTGSGGSTSGGDWGKSEDPSAGCPVTGTLPDYAALMADGKLPDPFKKLDGTRITDKSQWRCRRAEIVKQLAKYIYGEKPIPAKNLVSGTVSTTSITVRVTGGMKDVSFTASVSMNGATMPAPVLLSYGAGAPAPSGVAKITFSAIEASGGSGPKMGPFFDYYGTNHPAGYMVAQAWQVSRIIDVLEQNPTILDPQHFGVTGCSRNGKGAFAGGVFDNRIALTIPCESGIGGTPALRLKEQLDPGDNSTAEWPYHAISYVRWLSEVALGPFATANSASGDNTDRLPVDMHEAMALIAPRAIYIVDNPGITNLDPKSAYVTAMAGKAIFEALGVGDHFAMQGASGTHCSWRSQYDASLTAMVNKFLKGQTGTTGNMATDLGSKPTPTTYYNWSTTELPGNL
ncbi:MAG TPA: PE PGRS family protein [Polyangia bacterium]